MLAAARAARAGEKPSPQRRHDQPIFGILRNAQFKGRLAMRHSVPALAVAAALAIAPAAPAADIEAGKTKAATVCAACHGATGTSVSDTIPNLAGQKGRYIELQLKALREGSRKNPIMSVIAKQLSDDDIANVAAHFSAQQGSVALAKSDFLPNLAATTLAFPEDYKTTYT